MLWCRYNYSKGDEEIFKELYEIANDFIPNILKTSSSASINTENNAAAKNPNLTGDPSFFALVLQFYDGVCLWEEGSHTPVLHADWAKKLVQSISRFSPSCRSALSSSGASTLAPKPEPVKNDLPETETLVRDGASLSTANDNVEKSNSASTSVEKSKEQVALNLRSEKMRGMRDLLTTSGKINTSAIKLQLTAQSQVSVPKSRRRSSFKTDDYVYDFGEEAEGEEEEDEEEEESRPKKAMKPDRDYVAY